MSNWPLLNKARVTPQQDPHYGSTPDYGFNGFFCLRLNGLNVKCMASDGEGWKHVSVSIHGSTLPPSWAIMCKVKDLFWEPEDWVMQLHPAHSEYVNEHPGVLHLWQPLEQPIPKPPRIMVGAKDDDDRREINKLPGRMVTYLDSEGKPL